MKFRGVEIYDNEVITLVMKNRNIEGANAAPPHCLRLYSAFLERTRRIEKEAILHALV